MESARPEKSPLLMISGDRTAVRGEGGPFVDFLERFSHHWNRIEVLCPGSSDARPRTLFDRVRLHPVSLGPLRAASYYRAARRLLDDRPPHLIASHLYGLCSQGLR